MRAILAFTAFAFIGPVWGSDPVSERAEKALANDGISITWGTAPSYDRNAVLEIGDGSGHDFSLGWLLFQPGKDHIRVLSIQYQEERNSYKSKWPPDVAPVEITLAQMKPSRYAELLEDVATVEAATVRRVERDSGTLSFADFRVQTRLTSKNKLLIDLHWAGYEGSRSAVYYAKPNAMMTLAREATKELSFQKHELTETDREWFSRKFIREWKTIKEESSFWWVRERAIVTAGVAGDKSVLPTLREILESDVKDRSIYYTINAVTRLTKKDVRDKPIEEMDIKKTREVVLKLLRDKQP